MALRIASKGGRSNERDQFGSTSAVFQDDVQALGISAAREHVLAVILE
jgi:hypothetical protein